jgi:putative transcriptional regulator
MKNLSISNHVRTLRFHQGEMTQKDLAQKVGVSRQTIVAIEKGQYSPTLELCFKLAIVFETTIDEIFTVDAIDGKKWKKPENEE